jgi:hypothetical protein
MGRLLRQCREAAEAGVTKPPTTLPNPPHDPDQPGVNSAVEIVRWMFAEMDRQDVKYREIEEHTGVTEASLKKWRAGTFPTLPNAIAVIEYLQHELAFRPRVRPEYAKAQDGFTPIAAEHEISVLWLNNLRHEEAQAGKKK